MKSTRTKSQLLGQNTAWLAILMLSVNAQAAMAQSPAGAPAGGGSNPRLQEVRQENVQELMRFVNTEKTGSAIERVNKINAQADKFFKQGNTHEALIRWQDAYGDSIEMKYAEGQGKALIGMCKVALQQGKWVRAKQLGENAVEVLSAINAQTDLGRARVALAQAYFGLENPVWAAKQLEMALKTLVGQSDTDPLEASTVLNLAGSLLLQNGKHKEAIVFFHQSAQYLEQGNNLDTALFLRTKISSLMSELGWYVAALEEAQRGITIADKIPDKRAKITALCCLGNAQYVLGDFKDSKASYQLAYESAKGLDKNTPLIKEGRANLMMGYGFALASTGDTEAATKIFKDLLPFFEKSGSYYHHAELQNALGVIEATTGDIFNSVPYFEKAMEVQGLIKPEQPKLQIAIASNLACAKFRAGKVKEAMDHYNTFLPMIDKNPERFGTIAPRAYIAVAETAMKMADPVTAQKYLNKGLDFAKKYSDDSCLWRAYTLSAKINIANNMLDKAKEDLKAALSHFRSPQAGFYPSAESLGYPTTRRDFAHQLIVLVASQGMSEQALLAAEQLKEEQFNNIWNQREADVKQGDESVYKDLLKQKAHLHAAESSSTPDRLAKEWTNWITRFSTLARENKSLARLIAPYPTTVEEIINNARNNQLTTIEYLVGNTSTLCFTVDPLGRLSASVLPVGEERLKKQVAGVLSSLAGEPNGNDRVLLQNLYNDLFPTAVRGFLPTSDDKQIVIIPDGPLFNLPFAALVDENGKYFVENHLLTLAPSMRSLLDTPSSTATSLTVLVSANDSPSEQTESSQISSIVSPDLVTKLPQGDLLALQKEAEGKSVFHLSSSLKLADYNPMKVKLPFTQTTDKNQQTSAGQLFAINMPNDLVILSQTSVNGDNCEGKGIQVFSRGLTYAGARNVMMSLWSAPDNSRVSELASFYQNKKQGLNAAKSLRQAQLLSMSRDRNPRNWAAFQLLGPGM
ncbi:MAG: CHAT domain-containing protein [Cyanobacteria bacterium TGS_CYA1]|nr:CHAT domain-containing protein [Cyanobacteria bacterium TGS_CYA1]